MEHELLWSVQLAACAGGAGASEAAAQPPDLGACLLQQKLQMVALCIARRAAARRGGATTPTVAPGPGEFGAQLSLGSGHRATAIGRAACLVQTPRPCQCR